MFSKEFGWPPSVVASLTPAQMFMYISHFEAKQGIGTDPRTGRQTIRVQSLEEAQAYAAAIAAGGKKAVQ